jgi:hypothetical protein
MTGLVIALVVIESVRLLVDIAAFGRASGSEPKTHPKQRNVVPMRRDGE